MTNFYYVKVEGPNNNESIRREVGSILVCEEVGIYKFAHFVRMPLKEKIVPCYDKQGAVSYKKEVEYKYIPIICEQIDSNTYVDVINNRHYHRPALNEENLPDSPEITVNPLTPIKPAGIVNILKNLTPEEIAYYQETINKLDSIFAKYYNQYDMIKQAEPAQIAFIREFRERNANNNKKG